ncbi:hypothetical protein [Hyphococcus luteus]|uniref:Endonuclease n=1 Tax=Hyphococcus luteus TaxID=2058213 RepID=A0A2S7K3P5_9PROT|nr:hypothetical protein [Marinicaulis flavus]PQA87106.1 hypothetical protein CW354_13760 [Marinicaulis flavus]
MTQKDVVKALIREQGTLYSEAMGAKIEKNTPQELFHWLLGAILLSARISSENAVKAGKGLRKENLYKIRDILDTPRDERIKTLNENGYARFDNIGADEIYAAAELVDEKYNGDLRRLREEADGDDARARRLLSEVKGIGEMGANIFLREAQWPWEEFCPRLDGPAVKEAKDLGLPDDAGKLAKLAGSRERFVRLAAALTRAALEGPAEAVKKAAA